MNCDITIGETKHFIKLGYGQKAGTINPKTAKIPNFIVCDSRHLPFRDNAFKKVYCFHSLEHLRDWEKAFYEIMRVCRFKAVLKVPHKLSRTGRFLIYGLFHKDVHVSFFDMRFWTRFLQGNYRHIISLRHDLKHDRLFDIYFPFLCPVEIVVEVWK